MFWLRLGCGVKSSVHENRNKNRKIDQTWWWALLPIAADIQTDVSYDACTEAVNVRQGCSPEQGAGGLPASWASRPMRDMTGGGFPQVGKVFRRCLTVRKHDRDPSGKTDQSRCWASACARDATGVGLHGALESIAGASPAAWRWPGILLCLHLLELRLIVEPRASRRGVLHACLPAKL